MALGKIKADTLEHSTAGTIATNFVVNGSAKLWCLLDGTGTIGILDSLNSASATDNGTGDYTITATNAMSSANYACCATSGQNSGDQISANNNTGTGLDRTTTTVRTQCQRSTSDNALDCNVVDTIRMGDLA